MLNKCNSYYNKNNCYKFAPALTSYLVLRVAMKLKNRSSVVPSIIGLRTARLAPLLLKWRLENPGVPWAWLLEQGLKGQLEPLAGKRHAHLLDR